MENRFFFSLYKTHCVHSTSVRGLHLHLFLCLRGSTLSFVLTVKFLGLILDYELSWEPDLRWLMCQMWSHWVFQKFYLEDHGSRDWLVMLQLYSLLVHSKLDYGNSVYVSTTESKLSIINPVHSTGIHLATDAYCTCHLESLYSKSGFMEDSFNMWLYFKVSNSFPLSLTWCSFLFSIPQQVWINITASWLWVFASTSFCVDLIFTCCTLFLTASVKFSVGKLPT